MSIQTRNPSSGSEQHISIQSKRREARSGSDLVIPKKDNLGVTTYNMTTEISEKYDLN